ncbi:hypothetical protein D9613_006749 [Agrocybe pediades]|uniref:Uncharacterized protein n=1 Tax=Agrocybe pediades TaxID=84607 RepID=A0A8H4QHK1_9AGAR|nr:hypothetical protein D9613_006749 [Agrocybe pediades]
MSLYHGRLASCLKLPIELIHHFASQCGPGTLASLAATHPHFLSVAEELLYNDIGVKIGPDLDSNSMKLLKTLATTPRLCRLAKCFAVVHQEADATESLSADHSRTVIEMLREALISMQSLQELRVLLYTISKYGWVEGLQDILCTDKHPRLRAVSFPIGIDFAQIIQTHPNLRLMGMFIPYIFQHRLVYMDQQIILVLRNVRKIMRAADGGQALPVIFAYRHQYPSESEDMDVEEESDTEGPRLLASDQIDEICLFPDLVPAHAKDDFVQDIVDWLYKNENTKQSVESAPDLTLVLAHSFDGDLIESTVETLREDCYINPNSLSVFMQDDFIINQSQFLQILSHLPAISFIRFNLWPDEDSNEFKYPDEYLPSRYTKRMIRQWVHVLKNLEMVVNLDGEAFEAGDWGAPDSESSEESGGEAPAYVQQGPAGQEYEGAVSTEDDGMESADDD